VSERDRRRLVFAALAVALPLVLVAALSLGSVPLPAASVLRSALARLGIGGPTPLPEMGEVILWSVRLPRVLIAALVGGGLAVVARSWVPRCSRSSATRWPTPASSGWAPVPPSARSSP
jgi:ABC-type Fe3+-siderophore transport system permease subunit